MNAQNSPERPRWLALVAAVGALAALAHASCTLDAEGTAGNPPGTGGGAGGDTTTTTTSTTSGGGQGGSAPESDCTNGADDDDDGAADCADSDCTAVECVDPAAAGWEGGFRIQRVPYPAADPPSPCPDGSAPLVFYEGPAGAAQCDPCTCTFTGATCTIPQASCYWPTITCTGSANYTTQASDTNCIGDPPASLSTGSCMVTTASQVADPGSCTFDGGNVSGPAMWAEEIRACPAGPAGGGCAGDRICVPRSPGNFSPEICITHSGGADCPSGWTDVDVQAYSGGTDNRMCTACGCDTATVDCTDGSYTVYDGDNCGANSTSLGTSCQDLSFYVDNNTFSLQPVPGTPEGGTCTQPQPSGQVDPTGDTRICCR